MKKVNPRRRPATAADVQKAYDLGRSEAIEFALSVSCLSLMDIFSPTDEQMQAFNRKYLQNVEIGIDAIKSATDYVIEAIKSLK